MHSDKDQQNQRSIITYGQVPISKDYIVDRDALENVPNGMCSETTLTDDQQPPSIVCRDIDTQQLIASNSISKSFLLKKDHKTVSH